MQVHLHPSPNFAGTPTLIEEDEALTPPFGRPCRTYAGAILCFLERDEWMMVDALVSPQHTILELGARFGTTSCRLARATNNSGNVISVDPDVRTTKYLLRNRGRHHCNFLAVSGTVSAASLRMGPRSSYGQRTIAGGSSESAVPNFSLQDVERHVGSRINALLIDCEGCIGMVLQIPKLLSQVELILIEEDMYIRNGTGANPDECIVDYRVWHHRMRQEGFVQVWRSHDTHSPRRDIWSRYLYHSAWRRPSLSAAFQDGEANLCIAHKKAHKLPKHLLNCAPLDEGPWDPSNIRGGMRR